MSTLPGDHSLPTEEGPTFPQVKLSTVTSGVISWQQTPDVSTHNGSLLPNGVLSGLGWQLEPDVSAHIGKLLPVREGWPTVNCGNAEQRQQKPDMSTHFGTWLP